MGKIKQRMVDEYEASTPSDDEPVQDSNPTTEGEFK